MDILQVCLQSAASILLLFLFTRMTGKSSISQLTAFDYINGITIGSIAAELATNLEEWQKPLAALLIYGIASVLVAFLRCRFRRARLFFSGTPTVLYANGTLYKNCLHRCRIDINEFLTQCRLAGFYDLQQLQYAVLETNGQISFLAKAQHRPLTPQDMNLQPPPVSIFTALIQDGDILTENLKTFGKNEAWLMRQLHTADIGQLSDVFYACCDENGDFRAYRKTKSGQQPGHLFE